MTETPRNKAPLRKTHPLEVCALERLRVDFSEETDAIGLCSVALGVNGNDYAAACQGSAVFRGILA